MLRNAVVEVKDVPVFYLPMLYYPIQDDDRATGILLPMYGSSLATGSSISNAFFWAINRSHDATFFHDWMFSRGNGVGAEYRYLLGPQAQGDFQLLLARREGSGDQRPDAPARGRASRCAAASARTCRSACRRAARVDYITDVTVRQTYDHNFYNASNSTRSYQRRRLRRRGATCRRTARSNAPNRSRISTNSTVTGQTPGFTAALSGVRLGPLPIFATRQRRSGAQRS